MEPVPVPAPEDGEPEDGEPLDGQSLDDQSEDYATIAIRPATAGDAEAIVDLNVAAWQQAYRGIMPDRYLDGLSGERASRVSWQRLHIAGPADAAAFDLVAEYDGDVVGWLCGGPSRDDDKELTTGEVWAAYVSPEYWRCGVGTVLMTAALERLVELGYTEAVLWVFEENGRARRFYERFGWRPDGGTAIFERGGGQAIEIRYRRPLP